MKTTTHAVGIDLGTTYSCIASLNEHGEPITLPNEEGELSTPSVVLFDGSDVIVGTEALRNAIVHPDRVVQNSKRFMGDPDHRWKIGDYSYTPVDIATCILKKLLGSAQRQIGVIEHAVITVPAQFSDAQRHATIEAGHRAGLQRVDIINEPVAAALCHVLGTEGLWFTELADEQRILVYDLGGGTFDLSLVSYRKNEVKVIASSGDLHLGGIDWNAALLKKICKQFVASFKMDPRDDPSSLQALALEVEQTKRSLSVRPRAVLTCQHGGHRKTFQIDMDQFERLTHRHVERTVEITKSLLKDNKLGWAHVDVVLLTGGASRMPMIRNSMKALSGRTLNTTLSPDLSIAHGATYYAGMLLANDQFARSILNPAATERLSQIKQQSVNARGLGILVRDPKTRKRFPHYLIPANTPLPASATNNYGTVVQNQRRVHLQIVESGTSPEAKPAILGACIIEDLPVDLPEGSGIAVTISYDVAARVHVSARDITSGKHAMTEIIRQENLVPQLASDTNPVSEVGLLVTQPPRLGAVGKRTLRTKVAEQKPAIMQAPERVAPVRPAEARPAPVRKVVPPAAAPPSLIALKALETSDVPVPLCNTCGEPLDVRGRCRKCGTAQTAKPGSQTTSGRPAKSAQPKKPGQPVGTPKKFDNHRKKLGTGPTPAQTRPPLTHQKPKSPPSAQPPSKRTARSDSDVGEDEFWELVE